GGIRIIQEAILRRDEEGYRDAADWYRLFLCDIYLGIIGGKEKVALPLLLKNLPILLRVMLSASSSIQAMATRVLANAHFDRGGFHVGRAQMILGLLYKTKKKS